MNIVHEMALGRVERILCSDILQDLSQGIYAKKNPFLLFDSVTTKFFNVKKYCFHKNGFRFFHHRSGSFMVALLSSLRHVYFVFV